MTLAATVPINSYTGAGNTATYAFTYPVFSSAQLLVTITSPSPNYTTYILALGTDYSVSGLSPSGDPASTGSVVLINSGQAWLTSGNLTTGWVITIQRSTVLAQATSFRNGGDFYRSSQENALDLITMIAQEIAMQEGSQVQLPPSILASVFSPVLPANLPAGAGMAIGVNPSGTGLVLLSAMTGITIPVPIAQGGTGKTSLTSLTSDVGWTSGAKGIVGASDGSDAPAGKVGEIVSSTIGGYILSANGTWQTITSISLTAGRWRLSGSADVAGNPTGTLMGLAISAYTNNTTTDHVTAKNYIYWPGSSSVDTAGAIPGWYISISSSAPYYLKGYSSSGTNVTFNGFILAQRI
jgi:hypothetical protein